MDDKKTITIDESPIELITRLGIEFKDIHLLTRSLTHRSYLNEHPEALEDNENLRVVLYKVLCNSSD